MGKTELPKEPYWDGPLAHPFYSKVIKRGLDFLLALVLLVPGLLLMIPLAVWVKLDSEGPVIYKAVRGGYHNQPFRIYKFRSMVVDADKTGGCTAKNDNRVTRHHVGAARRDRPQQHRVYRTGRNRRGRGPGGQL